MLGTYNLASWDGQWGNGRFFLSFFLSFFLLSLFLFLQHIEQGLDFMYVPWSNGLCTHLGGLSLIHYWIYIYAYNVWIPIVGWMKPYTMIWPWHICMITNQSREVCRIPLYSHYIYIYPIIVSRNSSCRLYIIPLCYYYFPSYILLFIFPISLYGGFLKWGYPSILHFIFGFSINHPAIEIRPFMETSHYVMIIAHSISHCLYIPLSLYPIIVVCISLYIYIYIFHCLYIPL